jgi:superfamily II DNA or RNA helicase
VSGTDWLATLPPACGCLRPYQLEQIEKIRTAMEAGHRRVLVQLPTGGGKTHEIAAITAAAKTAGMRTLILATRTRLVRQIHERLKSFDVSHGVIAAALPDLTHAGAWVQVASVDTLYRRCLVDKRRPLPAGDVVIFDEAHLAPAPTRAAILEQYRQALLGFTATPARRSGKPLRDQFDVLIPGLSVRELIDLGQLVRPRIFNVPVVTEQELKDIPKDATRDYQQKALGDLMVRPKLVGDVIENWSRIAPGRRTLVFAIDKRHGEALVERFMSAGVKTELLTDEDGEETREAVVARLESGETTVIVNCFLLSYGVDIPLVSCIVLARPTRSLVLYMQSVGRGLRPAEGKSESSSSTTGASSRTWGSQPIPSTGAWKLAPTSTTAPASGSREAARPRSRRNEAARSASTCGESARKATAAETAAGSRARSRGIGQQRRPSCRSSGAQCRR